MDYEQFKIKEYRHWSLQLRENQSYLGWCLLWAKRDELSDLMDITADEERELFAIARDVKKALTELFHPDMFNWAALGNKTPHLHLQIIPRYREPREFAGARFEDGRWGQNYSPYKYDLKMSDEIMVVLREMIKNKLS